MAESLSSITLSSPAALWHTYVLHHLDDPALQPYELFIGLRYTRAKRRNHFISFISLISMLGMGLGVMARKQSNTND